MPFCKSGIALLLAVAVVGCVSQNPLIDEPKSDVKPIVSTQAQTADSADSANRAQVSRPEGFKRFLGYISPYRISVQQGNFISKETISQLKEGMTREQVRFLLGTALLTDIFHEDRWDYPFSLLKPNGDLISSRVIVYFKNNVVVKFEGGDLPTERDYLALITESAIKDKIETNPQGDSGKKKKE